MNDTVDCPYCQFDNDMEYGTVDLPENCRFDHECESCEEEFDVYVDFHPIYSSNKIIYKECCKCKREMRDFYRIDRGIACWECYAENLLKEMREFDKKGQRK